MFYWVKPNLKGNEIHGTLLKGKCRLKDALDSDYCVCKNKEMEISREQIHKDTLYILVTESEPGN